MAGSTAGSRSVILDPQPLIISSITVNVRSGIRSSSNDNNQPVDFVIGLKSVTLAISLSRLSNTPDKLSGNRFNAYKVVNSGVFL